MLAMVRICEAKIGILRSRPHVPSSGPTESGLSNGHLGNGSRRQALSNLIFDLKGRSGCVIVV